MTDYTRELKIAELIVRQEIGELDTAEQQALSRWLEESEAHAALYRRLLTKPQTISSAAEFDTERFIRGTQRKIQQQNSSFGLAVSLGCRSLYDRSVFCLIHPGKQASRIVCCERCAGSRKDTSGIVPARWPAGGPRKRKRTGYSLDEIC